MKKKEAIGIQPGGVNHPITAFSGSPNYVPKPYDQFGIKNVKGKKSKAKRALELLFAAES